MKETVRPRVKICCIGSVAEARAAVEAGASALGFVSEMPSGPGVIAEELMSEIIARVPPAVATFLLTCRQEVEAIVEQQRRTRAGVLQLCDRVDRGVHEKLRARLPGVRVVQVIHVAGEESVEEAERVAPHVDAVLLDSGNQKLAVKELGGTGRVHDWDLSLRIRERVGVPVFLAGGLNASNVAAAVRRVGPFAVDVCSGVRTEGRLDAEKLEGFFRALPR